MKQIICTICVWFALLTTVSGAEVVWFDGAHPVTYEIPKNADLVVMTALEMWKDDMRQVTGLVPVASDKAVIKVIQGKGAPDGFRIYIKGRQIIVEGNI